MFIIVCLLIPLTNTFSSSCIRQPFLLKNTTQLISCTWEPSTMRPKQASRSLLGGPIGVVSGHLARPCSVRQDASKTQIWAAFRLGGQPGHYASGHWAKVESHILTPRPQTHVASGRSRCQFESRSVVPIWFALSF
jgi:hypothetical protein